MMKLTKKEKLFFMGYFFEKLFNYLIVVGIIGLVGLVMAFLIWMVDIYGVLVLYAIVIAFLVGWFLVFIYERASKKFWWVRANYHINQMKTPWDYNHKTVKDNGCRGDTDGFW